MDEAYNQHSSHSWRNNRSTTNLNRLSLAPLTSKLPLRDHEELLDSLSAPSQHHSISYLQGKSAPTTPRLLSRSPGRSRSQTRGSSTPSAMLPKSKSASHLALSHSRHSASGSGSGRRRCDELASSKDRGDTDWLLRAGALISTETRESKGQSWLVSRASSTSLTGSNDAEEEAFERELAREREFASRNASHNPSRRCSVAPLEEHVASPSTSRFGSRSQSRVGSRSQIATPSERRSAEGYFPPQEDYIAGPDFVNLDERLEAIELDTSHEDEAHVRRLVKDGNAGAGGWFGNILGWGLSSVEENEEESDGEGDGDGDGEGGVAEGEVQEAPRERRRSSARQFKGVITRAEERFLPPKADEGGWQDAAWLLSVASRVLL